ncbi:hypothetical protein U1Q18_043380 [Sarracenia purpurea var. burkii]
MRKFSGASCAQSPNSKLEVRTFTDLGLKLKIWSRRLQWCGAIEPELQALKGRLWAFPFFGEITGEGEDFSERVQVLVAGGGFHRRHKNPAENKLQR